jgi:hypothetical protein
VYLLHLLQLEYRVLGLGDLAVSGDVRFVYVGDRVQDQADDLLLGYSEVGVQGVRLRGFRLNLG